MRTDRDTARAALAGYGLGEYRLAPLSAGMNTNFRVDTADGRYVLRLQRDAGNVFHPPRTEAMVRSELAWVAALRRDLGLLVPDVVPAADGEPVVVAHGRTCVLMRWRHGRFLEAGLRPVHLERVGRTTALMHEHAFAPPPGFERPPVDEVSGPVVGHVLALVTAVAGEGRAEVAAAVLDRTAAAQRDLGREHHGMVHGDLHHENYLFDGRAVAVIDFDDCGWAYHLYDLAVTVSEVQHLSRYRELRAALLRGYRSVRPLPEEHERHLDTLVDYRALQLAVAFHEEDPRRSELPERIDALRGRMPG